MGRKSEYKLELDVVRAGSCPKCQAKMGCIDSRKNEGYTRRRWECVACGFRLSTAEVPMDIWLELCAKAELLNSILDAVAHLDLDLKRPDLPKALKIPTAHDIVTNYQPR